MRRCINCGKGRYRAQSGVMSEASCGSFTRCLGWSPRLGTFRYTNAPLFSPCQVVATLPVQVTGQLILDPVVALLVAANIAWTAFRLLRASALGLMDTALPQNDQKIIRSILERYEGQGISFHAFRSRMSGQRCFISMHVLMPGTGA
jgi:hypothetical protein